ncbi:MAG: LLM class flavin-dependent oxidoreductase [Chloroflexi bacterium]|nr:LLM class flavin-dependent oxidoreductase [Chloroflexota bacterium]
MKIDIFSEMQHPKELWGDDGQYEHRLFEQTLDQAKLADEMGYGCWWEVEHHTAVEFSFSSAPELMLTAIAQHTNQINVGHAAVLAPSRFNHAIRIAERAAFLDHLSNGRLQMGLARSTVPEWRTFNIDADSTRDQLQQTFEMVPKMWTQDKFSWKSDQYEINDVSIIPKPYQKPHPPLWQACSSIPSFEQAGRNGVGALGVTLWASHEEVQGMVDIYRKASAECEKPVGEFQNNQIAFFTFVHGAESQEEALANGAAGAAAWYTNEAFSFFEVQESFIEVAREMEAAAKDPAGGGLVGQYARDFADPSEAAIMIGRIMEGEQVGEDEMFDVLSRQESLIVGDRDKIREGFKFYEEVGIDRLMTLHQVGPLSHDKIMKSIRLVGEVIPEFDRP